MTLALRVPDCVVYMDEQQRVNIGLMRGLATLGVEFAFCAVLIAWAGFVLSQIGLAQRMPPDRARRRPVPMFANAPTGVMRPAKVASWSPRGDPSTGASLT